MTQDVFSTSFSPDDAGLTASKPPEAKLTRRSLVTAAAGLTASGALGLAPSKADEPDNGRPPWQEHLGEEILHPPYGVPSARESQVIRRLRNSATQAPTRYAAFSLTPHQSLSGIITPNGLHYERHHSGVPDVDPDKYKLLIHGLVERPLIFTMDDLTRFPSVSRIYFVECSGNTQTWGAPKPNQTVQDTHGLLSCSEWTGVPLAAVFAEAGVRPEGKWFLAEGGDAAAVARSIPIEKAYDDAILAYAQNGERLRPEQGYPLRLLLPGFEGNTSIKWLRRLKIGTAPFQTRWETSKYSLVLPDHTIRQFDFVMDAKSVITSPSGGQSLKGPGFYEISGLAWSGRGKVTRVEVSVDGGNSWRDAALQEPVLSKCLTRFRFPWQWDGAPARLASRTTDESGYVQPSHAELEKIRDVRSYYHNNAIQTWAVSADGSVVNA